jgi:hypothetical protein
MRQQIMLCGQTTFYLNILSKEINNKLNLTLETVGDNSHKDEQQRKH